MCRTNYDKYVQKNEQELCAVQLYELAKEQFYINYFHEQDVMQNNYHK